MLCVYLSRPDTAQKYKVLFIRCQQFMEEGTAQPSEGFNLSIYNGLLCFSFRDKQTGNVRTASIQHRNDPLCSIQNIQVISVLIFYNKFPLTNYAGRNKVDENYGCILLFSPNGINRNRICWDFRKLRDILKIKI